MRLLQDHYISSIPEKNRRIKKESVKFILKLNA